MHVGVYSPWIGCAVSFFILFSLCSQWVFSQQKKKWQGGKSELLLPGMTTFVLQQLVPQVQVLEPYTACLFSCTDANVNCVSFPMCHEVIQCRAEFLPVLSSCDVGFSHWSAPPPSLLFLLALSCWKFNSSSH